MKTLLTILAATVLPSLTPLSFGANATPDYYLCTGKVGGEWNYGRAPNGCNASAFGSDTVVKNTYGDLVFQDGSERTAERKRYMDDLHAVIRDAAQYYIKKRKPTASAAEIDAFTLGMLTTAAQETYWSHYRYSITDSRYKMMRGDYGHGHGLMQVDDRYHYPAVTNGTAWNLIGNMTYSMDEFFTAWERAPSQTCVGSATNWNARIRSSWAAYNGGPTKICRWTNTKDTWAQNDKNFNSHLTNQTWKAYVKDLNKAAPINVACLIENRENCPAPGIPVTPLLQENVLYRTVAEKPCVLVGAKLQCMSDFRDSVCLRTVSAFTNAEAVVVTDAAIKNYPQTVLDRHATCTALDPSLVAVGAMIKANALINLRATAGGGLIGTFAKDATAEVLDFEIRNLATRDRYYKIRTAGVDGFIYAGKLGDYAKWVSAYTPPATTPSLVAKAGERVQIVNKAGINQRSTANGPVLLGNIPFNATLTVIAVQTVGSTNAIYYKVTYASKTGFIHSGQLLPTSTIGLWTKKVP